MTQSDPGLLVSAARDALWENPPPLADGCEHDFRRLQVAEFRQTVTCSRCGGLDAGLSRELTEHPERFGAFADRVERLAAPRPAVGLYEVMFLAERVVMGHLLERLTVILEQDAGVPPEKVDAAMDLLFDHRAPSADTELAARWSQEVKALWDAAPRWLGIPGYGDSPGGAATEEPPPLAV